MLTNTLLFEFDRGSRNHREPMDIHKARGLLMVCTIHSHTFRNCLKSLTHFRARKGWFSSYRYEATLSDQWSDGKRVILLICFGWENTLLPFFQMKLYGLPGVLIRKVYAAAKRQLIKMEKLTGCGAEKQLFGTFLLIFIWKRKLANREQNPRGKKEFF